jgi:hypothetical protein
MLDTLALLCSSLGCAGGQEVTTEAIEKAKNLWSQAGILDYELEWTTTGPNNAHYDVTVRGGEVRRVESVVPDGRRIELHPGAPRYFGVDGLFLTMANELAQKKSERPFGQPPGTRVVMRFEPDPNLGYPHWYRRDVLGTPQAVTIDVLRLVAGAPTSNGSK